MNDRSSQNLTTRILISLAVGGVLGICGLAPDPSSSDFLARLCALAVAGIAIILGVDRILDRSRTVLNVAADVVTAAIVDRQLAPAMPTSS